MKSYFIYRSYNRYRVKNIWNRSNEKVYKTVLTRPKFGDLVYADFARFSDGALLYVT
jgi:hypothetical protein